MASSIPTYSLHYFSNPADKPAEVFFLDEHTHSAGPPLNAPYRGNYYKIGICLRGTLELKANLETYSIEPNCLMLITPHVIKEWAQLSDDHDSLSVFFTKEFITSHNSVQADSFHFLENITRHVLPLSEAEATTITASLRFLQQKFPTPHPYREQVIKNLINSLLYEVIAIYDQHHAVLQSTQTRGQQLTSAFKNLVNAHSAVERSVKFYADQLCITPKHLTETVREITGKTASDWIEQAVLLEAKALLQNQQLSVAQISELLHFTDQSAFSRFFRKSLGFSPTAYKQAG
ncbi:MULTISPECIES: helix-turn-helix domain-containing protein [Hymenobacter]|uniref:Helix-turn-helix domain-containing protein n=1 Tax=Hymenobacter profundi TaxID=1982110 RepID=A0ABS6X371_9BACT|nr:MULTISPECIES: helix-turn-helix domain-containing protein [Hymenobacter]MBW3130180.1 helix-turn-helix domain-containing protein [Hymenobacter profundi]QNE39452.1 AraC family transcriptional regulator [Hymenobacter sp. NBH84]